MTPLQVKFTGLTLDPADVQDRVHQGVFPSSWHRYRFPVEQAMINTINRWLADNIEGRWAIVITYTNAGRECTIAFEKDFDATMFVISDGPNQCCAEL